MGDLGFAAQALALLLIAAAIVSGLGALMARALFAMCMHLVVCAASAAAALLLLRAGDGALALVLLGVGWAPILLLAGMLLSARAAKPTRSRPWASLIAAAMAAAAVIWSASDLREAPAVAASAPNVAFWIAPLVFVAAVAVGGLLGFGERGALERGQ